MPDDVMGLLVRLMHCDLLGLAIYLFQNGTTFLNVKQLGDEVEKKRQQVETKFNLKRETNDEIRAEFDSGEKKRLWLLERHHRRAHSQPLQ